MCQCGAAGNSPAYDGPTVDSTVYVHASMRSSATSDRGLVKAEYLPFLVHSVTFIHPKALSAESQRRSAMAALLGLSTAWLSSTRSKKPVCGCSSIQGRRPNQEDR